MDWNNENIEEQQKIQHSIGFGCFFVIVILALLFLLVFVWIPVKFIDSLYHPEEPEIKVSHSPNNKKQIEFFRVEDFPSPTLRIYFGEESIVINNLPKNISVEWKNDNEADVILTRKKNEPLIEKNEFK